MKLSLLEQYIREILGAVDPWATGKDYHAGNLYASNAEQLPAGIRGRGNNVIDDEESEVQLKRQATKQAACCLIMSADGKVLAVSRKTDPSMLGLPGGKVDPGEEPIDAAARELKEETGLDALDLSLIFSRRDAQGFVTTTFACHAGGEINTSEAGVIRWVEPSVLVDPASSPYVDYNRALFAKLGIRC